MAIHATARSSPSSAPPHPSRPALFLRTLIPSGATSLTLACHLLPPSLQLVTATPATLSVLTIDAATQSLQPLCTAPLFSPPRALAALSDPSGHDVLLVLAPESKLFFLSLDVERCRLTLAGETALSTPFNALGEGRLLAVHPGKRVVAVASLSGSISIFPLLFLAKGVTAGKAVNVPLSGVVLGMDFLEDDGGDAVLLALLQDGGAQQLSAFVVSSTESGAIAVRKVAPMINCASHPDDTAVARAAAKLTGAVVRPAEQAVNVCRLEGCPYLFAVFVKGRVIAGDARAVVTASGGKGGSQHFAVRVEDTADAGVWPFDLDLAMREGEASSKLGRPPTFSGVGMHSSLELQAVAAVPDSDTAFHTPRLTRPPHMPVTPTLAPRSNVGEDFLSYLAVPPYITLDVGDENGAPIAWVDARDHFRDATGDGSGLYFVMESGAMFALRWNDKTQDGAVTYRIPGAERVVARQPKHNFCVEFVGDVGPAVTIAALDRGLLYVANDGADGSLRKLHVPKWDVYRKTQMGPALGVRKGGRAEVRRFGLEVRQEFLNLAPISDFIIVPPAKRHARKEKRSRGSAPDDGMRHADVNCEGQGGDSGCDLGRPELVARDVEMAEELTPHRLDLTADPRSRVRLREPREPREPPEDTSASSHAMYGANKECEIVLCSGFGRHGSIRMIRPGAPVTIFASSGNTFTACNDMWPVRFTKDSKYDAGVLLTFAQATGILYSVPMTMMEQMQQADGVPAVAKLVDGTQATNLRSDVRTVATGTLEDGILAQVHENGVRLMYLKKVDELPSQFERSIEDGVLTESVCKRTLEWVPPDGGFISVGAIGSGCALVCIVRRGQQNPLLCLLKLFPDDFNKGIFVVSTTVLDHELSAIVIPEWTTGHLNQDITSPSLPPMAVLGSYAPSVEVRLLGPTLEVLDRRATYPWSLNKFGWECAANLNNSSGDHSRSEHSRDEASEWTRRSLFLRHSKSAVCRMTAVPESLCALIVDGRKLVFTGLRDGSVVCFSFSDVDDLEHRDPKPPHMGQLRVNSHRKLGHRPVVVKALTAGIGPVVIGQTERPWVCTGLGGGKLRWIPLAFTETRAMCGYSILGAERCFAVVSEDEVLHICGLRRRSEVAVRSIYIGATPRRVIALSSPENSIIVATCRVRNEDPPLPPHSGYRNSEGRERGRRVVHSELRVYNKKLRVQTGGTTLIPGEQVHVLLNWLGFIIVGTSCDIRTEKSCGIGKICDRGRLMLYTVRSKTEEASSSSAVTGGTKLSLCSEVVLPGAVLSGAAHPTARVFVISCNEEVIVFGVPRSRSALVEIARVSVRALVVSISICEDVICVVDRKDSIGFFALESGSGKLVRDRGDHCRRIVSDAVMVDRTLAIAVDRRGAVFSIGYDEGDAPKHSPILWPDGHGVHMLIDRTDSLATAEEFADGASGNPLPSEGIGEEFDIVHPESGSENTTESNEQSPSAGISTEEEPASGETDQVMANESSASQDESVSEGTTNNAGTGEVANTQDAGTNTANPTQSTEDGILAIEQPNVPVITTNIMSQYASAPTNQNIVPTVPRNLVCHHTFNMSDTALCIRYGTFNRREKEVELEERKVESLSQSKGDQDQFFRDASAAVFCGTLGGALVAAVPMSAATYGLLGQVEAELRMHPDIAGPALGVSHKKFRAAYGSRAKGTVDGDLLNYFDTLSRCSKLEIGARVGCPGEQGVLHIEGVIRDLFDRVS